MGYTAFLSLKTYRSLWNAWALSADWSRATNAELEFEAFSPNGAEGLVPIRHELARRWLAVPLPSSRRRTKKGYR